MPQNAPDPFIIKILDLLDSVKPSLPETTQEVKTEQINESFDLLTIKHDSHYFTIVVDDEGWHCVEFYRYKDDALLGHDSWARRLKAGQRSFIGLTFHTHFPYKEVELVPFNKRKIKK